MLYMSNLDYLIVEPSLDYLDWDSTYKIQTRGWGTCFVVSYFAGLYYGFYD